MLYVNQFADFHIHAYAPFEKGFACFEKMASLHIRDVNMLAYTYIETGIDNNLVCLYYKDKCKAVNLRTFGGLYYDRDLNNSIMPYKEQAELLLAMGCDGIKLLDMKPNYQLYCGCKMDDAVYDAMYDMLEERHIPLDCHIADPANFWHKETVAQHIIDLGWCYEDPKFLTQQQIFDAAIRRLEKNPTLRITFAHFGFMSQRIELCRSLMERFPNVCFDLAPGWEIFVDFAQNADEWRAFFLDYADRILYGTDSSTNSQHSHLANLNRTMTETVSHDSTEFLIPHYPVANMRGFDLPAEAQQKILHDNYFRILGDTPAKIDYALVRDHAKLITGIAEKQGLADVAATAKFVLENI